MIKYNQSNGGFEKYGNWSQVVVIKLYKCYMNVKVQTGEVAAK